MIFPQGIQNLQVGCVVGWGTQEGAGLSRMGAPESSNITGYYLPYITSWGTPTSL